MQPLPIGIAGYGLVGRRHAEAVRACPDAALLAVAEPGPEAAEAVRAAGLTVVPDLDALLALSPGAVILATPNAAHVPQGLACVGAGIPTLIEKPLADTADEGARLVDAAARAGVPLLTGHHRRHNPRVAAARSAIAAGRIGAVRAVQATCWLGKPDAYFDAGPWRTAHGAGPSAINLIHDIDLMRHLVGEIARVRAASAPSRRGHAAEDLLSALVEFEGGAIGTVSVSDAIPAPWSWELTAAENPAYPATGQSCYLIGGAEGSLSVPDLRLWRHEGAGGWMSEMGATALMAGAADPLVAQVANLVAVARGAEPVCSGAEGLRTLRVLEAIQRAARTGTTETVEAAAEVAE